MFRALTLLTIFSLVAVVAQADPPDEADPAGGSSELAKLQGTWELVKLVRDGKTFDDEEIEDARLIVDEDEYTFKTVGGKRFQGTLVMDARKKPAVMQTTHAEANESIRRIYVWLTPKSIQICTPGPGETVPDKFESTEGSGRELAVWRKLDK